jgi:hypothetical protein
MKKGIGWCRFGEKCAKDEDNKEENVKEKEIRQRKREIQV